MTTEKNKPVEVFKDGAVKAAVFEREVEGSNGAFISRSVALQIGFKKDGEWQNSSITVVQRNLQKTINVLQEAVDHCVAEAQ